MGKPYDLELRQLRATYRLAMATPVDRLPSLLSSAASLPLVAIGSGGSLTTADFAAALHRKFTGKLASAMTPMEAAVPSLDLRGIAVVLATAGGKNPDVLAALPRAAVREPRRFIVLCMTVGSPLARLGAKYPFVDFVEVDLPSGKDGFLGDELSSGINRPPRAGLRRSVWHAMSAAHGPFDSSADRLRRATLLTNSIVVAQPLWQRETIVVLHGPAIHSAAIDLESKFTEAALGNVQLADYRHFAHGRHHWLAKHPQTTGILAFVTPHDEEIASTTLKLIPANIPVHRVDLPFEGSTAGIAALAWGLHVVGSAGRARGINPGRPGVPGFGRRIYHLKAATSLSASTRRCPRKRWRPWRGRPGKQSTPLPARGNSASGGTPTRHSLSDLQRRRSARSCSTTTERCAMRRIAARGFPRPWVANWFAC